MKKTSQPLGTVLVIDTSERDQTKVGVVLNGASHVLVEPVRAQELQRLIATLLKNAGLSISQLDAIACRTGAGSFTGTRIGITAANTLAWTDHLPIVDLGELDFEAACEQLNRGKKFPLTGRLSPRY